MPNIIFISTVHKEVGKCNADELCSIIEKIRPEVIFLEALDNTYSNYEKLLFSSFGIFHKKLEIKAIQMYCSKADCAYVPVLDSGLPEAFDMKLKMVCENKEFQIMIDHFNSLARENGFNFLNSAESVRLHQGMRIFEDRLLEGSELKAIASEDINAYENSMMRNIYSYCRNDQFDTAIFMCGSAHRQSIIEKIERSKSQGETNINWIVFPNLNTA